MKDLFSKPNQITFIRILLIPVFVAFLLLEIPYRDYIAAFIFIMLSASDALDGYIARRKKQITGIGKIIDPIADKLLISAALIFLIGRLQLWMAVVIIVREIVITVARLFLLPKKVIAASILGKIKTVSQIVAIVAVIINFPYNYWLMLIAVVITVLSGFDYLIKMGRIIEENVINMPNIITTFRLLLIPLFIISLTELNKNLALLIGTIIIISDKLDGVSARITAQITKFGRIYDGFTDFILVISSCVAFYMTGKLDLFWVIIFLIPSVVLTVAKIAYFSKLNEPHSSPLGKILMGMAYAAIIALIIDFVYDFYILISVAVLSYAYMIISAYRNSLIKKPWPKSF